MFPPILKKKNKMDVLCCTLPHHIALLLKAAVASKRTDCCALTHICSLQKTRDTPLGTIRHQLWYHAL